MHYRQLGQSDLRVSVVCQGCWSIATKDVFWDGQDRADSFAAIRAARDAGINFFDTAPAYGNGESEEILGEALGAGRSQAIVATKVAPADLEPDRLRRSCENSLRALRTDYIDLYQVHWPSHTVPLEATYRTLEDLRQEGKIRWLGVSNFGVSYLDELLALGRVESNQVPYSLVWRAVEFEIGPRCRRDQVGLLCYSPLAQGLLTGKFSRADEVPLKRARTRLFSRQRGMTRHGEPGCEQTLFSALDAIRHAADALGQPMGHVALAWLLCQPAVTSVVAGARSASQSIDNAAAAEIALDESSLESLSRITEPLKQAMGCNADPWEHVSRMDRP